MYIHVIYQKTPSLSVKRKSKCFFIDTEYIYRNNVFVHPKLDSVFSLSKNSIHIRIPDNDFYAQNITKEYLNSIFGNKSIGLKGLNEENLKMFKNLNYIVI